AHQQQRGECRDDVMLLQRGEDRSRVVGGANGRVGHCARDRERDVGQHGQRQRWSAATSGWTTTLSRGAFADRGGLGGSAGVRTQSDHPFTRKTITVCKYLSRVMICQVVLLRA